MCYLWSFSIFFNTFYCYDISFNLRCHTNQPIESLSNLKQDQIYFNKIKKHLYKLIKYNYNLYNKCIPEGHN